MSRKTAVVSAIFSLFLAACGPDETPTTGNVADAGCPSCPACPILDAGVCPECPDPRLVVHFASNTPQGPSAPAFEETMVKAILTASMDEDIRVNTLTFRVRATSQGLGDWKFRWDDDNTLDSGGSLEYSPIDWAIITAHVGMELPAGSNMAVSLYMDTQTMRVNDTVSLQINGATAVGVDSGTTATVTVPTATINHYY